YVATTHDWMRDYGTDTFKPETVETKQRWARALHKAFAPSGVVDPTLSFPDVPTTNPYYPDVNIVVKNGWMAKRADGTFAPANPMSTTMVHSSLVAALGLSQELAGLQNLHLDDGTTLTVDPRFAANTLGIVLGLRYNHGTESEDVEPTMALHRDEAAWSLYK